MKPKPRSTSTRYNLRKSKKKNFCSICPDCAVVDEKIAADNDDGEKMEKEEGIMDSSELSMDNVIAENGNLIDNSEMSIDHVSADNENRMENVIIVGIPSAHNDDGEIMHREQVQLIEIENLMDNSEMSMDNVSAENENLIENSEISEDDVVLENETTSYNVDDIEEKPVQGIIDKIEMSLEDVIAENLNLIDNSEMSIDYENADEENNDEHSRPLIINGAIDLWNVKFQGKYYRVKNTCAFDSLLVAFTNGYVDFHQFKTYVDNLMYRDSRTNRNKKSLGNLFLELCKRLTLDNSSRTATIIKHVYRTVLLFKTNEHTDPILLNSGTISLDCSTNVIGLINRILSTFMPSCVPTITCQNCRATRKKYNNSTIFLRNLKDQENFNTLNLLLYNFLKPTTNEFCKFCKHYSSVKTTELMNHILIETDQKNDYVNLIDIPADLFVNNKRFILAAVIGYIRGPIGHYITCCKRTEGHWEYHDDLLLSIVKVSPSTTKVIPHILFYILDEQ